MTIPSWFRWLRRNARPSTRRPVRFRPCVESLEARTLLSFSSVTSFPSGTNTIGVAAADFNHDNRIDLAAVTSNGTLAILAGNGDATFKAPVNFGAGASPQAVVSGDFNNDGNADLAIAN